MRQFSDPFQHINAGARGNGGAASMQSGQSGSQMGGTDASFPQGATTQPGKGAGAGAGRKDA
jgi:hypothetical protein